VDFSRISAINKIFSLPRNKKSKGIAYVEYENPKSAPTAVMKTDQTEFMERTLTVAISAPPKSNVKYPLAREGFSSTPKPMTARPEQKSRISFVPASVQKAAIKEASASPTN
jgi:RNA recognition motif-containing protein